MKEITIFVIILVCLLVAYVLYSSVAGFVREILRERRIAAAKAEPKPPRASWSIAPFLGPFCAIGPHVFREEDFRAFEGGAKGGWIVLDGGLRLPVDAEGAAAVRARFATHTLPLKVNEK